jgi:hypothetical protein
MDVYEQSLTELDAAEAAYSAAVEKVAKAQDTRSKNGKKDKAATEALKKAKKELAAAEQDLIKA